MSVSSLPRLLACGCSVLATVVTLPAAEVAVEVAGLYNVVADPSVSDEFNEPTIDRDRWAYRTQSGDEWGTGSGYVYSVDQGDDKFVSIKGNWSEAKGSGLAAKTATQFGFYSVRWRTAGISPSWRTPWHPAIWMGTKNFAGGEDERQLPPDATRLEIDLMEYWHNPVWHSQVIAWESLPDGGFANPKFLLRERQNDFPTIQSGWQTYGVEYHPDYLQLWQDVGGDWEAIGQTLSLTDGPTTDTSINRSHASAGYWILSNKYHWDEVSAFYAGEPPLQEFRLDNSRLHVDFFRYHPLRQAGDFTGDGDVEADDYYLWREFFGQTGSTHAWADGNADGVIDSADYTIWRDSIRPIATTVPEPTAVVGMTCVWFIWILRGRRRAAIIQLPGAGGLITTASARIYRFA